MPRDEALRQAQYYLRQLTIGQLRDRWFNTHSVKRVGDDDAKARSAIEGHLAHTDPYQPFDHPYYWVALFYSKRRLVRPESLCNPQPLKNSVSSSMRCCTGLPSIILKFLQ